MVGSEWDPRHLGSYDRYRIKLLIINNNRNRNQDKFPLIKSYQGMLGYKISLKESAGGLRLVADISASCFLKSGPLIEIMMEITGYIILYSIPLNYLIV